MREWHLMVTASTAGISRANVLDVWARMKRREVEPKGPKVNG